jgi:hypothetical protein
MGPIWEEARAIAKERGDKLPAIIEAALCRYVARHRRTKKEGKP